MLRSLAHSYLQRLFSCIRGFQGLGLGNIFWDTTQLMAPRTKVSLWCPFYRWGDQSGSHSEEVMDLKCKPMWSDFRTCFFLSFFFLMWTILKVFIEFVTILLLPCVLNFWPWGMWKLSSQTRNWTHTSCIGRQSLNHWMAREEPRAHFKKSLH